jgi:hypothetical protein
MSAPLYPPPPGPGVQPPFVAPPTDGVRQRRWLAAGLAGGTALLLCIGGIFGLGGLIVLGGQAVLDKSRAAVTDYLTAVQARDYDKAYDQLCEAEQARQSKLQFEHSFEGPRITTFTVSDPDLSGQEVVVPATISYESGGTRVLRYRLVQNSQTGDFEVCGLAG